MNDEMIRYLKEHLAIRITESIEFGPVQQIKVELVLGDEVISEDSITLELES